MKIAQLLGLGFAVALSAMACGGGVREDGTVAGAPGDAPSSRAPVKPGQPPPRGTALASLTIAGAALTPVFTQSVTRYQAAVEVMSKTPFTITPTTADPAATVTVNGIAVASGTASKPIRITEMYNPVDVAVAAPGERPEPEVLLDRQAGEDAAASGGLHDAAGCCPLRGLTGDGRAVEPHVAAVGLDQAVDGVERRGLAGTVGPEQSDDLALADLQVHAEEHLHAVVGDSEVLGLEQQHAAVSARAGAGVDVLRVAASDVGVDVAGDREDVEGPPQQHRGRDRKGPAEAGALRDQRDR